MKAVQLSASSMPGYAIPKSISMPSKDFRRHGLQSHVLERVPCTSRLQSAIVAKEQYVLAIDVGTSGTKAALISSNGAVAISSFSSHPAPAPSVLGGQASAEQDPCSWWLATKSAVNVCLSKLLSLPHQQDTSLIQALAVTGQMQDVILVPQGEGCQQRHAILYSDARATLEANEVSHLAGGDDNLANLTGAKQGATSLLAKLRWLDKHEPAAFLECQGVLIGGHDYIVWRLCRRFVTDATTASTTGLTDHFGQYSEVLLESVGLHHWLHKLPPVTSVEVPCGQVSKEAAKELGYVSLQGIPVLHCCGDNGACSLGAGAGSPGSLYAYIGTSGWVAGSFSRSLQTFNKELLVPGVFTLAHPNSSLVFKTGSIMTAGGNLAWAASNLQDSSKTEKVSWEALNQQAAHAPPGSKGLLYLPYLKGERCPFEDPHACAAFIGITSSVSAAEMYRSVMEGVSFALLSAGEALSSSQDSGPLRLVGGGARSPVWPTVLANIFGKTVDVLEDAQDVGVKGAALLAGKWLGWHRTLSPGGWLRIKESVCPCSKTVEKYKELFVVYKTAYLGLQETFRLLSKHSEA